MQYWWLVGLTILGWSAGATACKVATNYVSPLMLAAITTGIYVLLMPFLFVFIKFDRTVNAVGIGYSVLGALCMALGSVFYFFALQKGDAGITTLLAGIYPSLTLLLSCLFLGEPITVKKVVGFLVVLLGSFILTRG